MVPFGGWEMPLNYEAGTVAEHLACRNGAVAFDVSHLGTVRTSGSDALGRLQAALTNDLAKIGPGRAQYTHLLDEADGSVLDDIIVWWLGEEVFDVMPNASNTERVVDALGPHAVDVTTGRACLAGTRVSVPPRRCVSRWCRGGTFPSRGVGVERLHLHRGRYGLYG